MPLGALTTGENWIAAVVKQDSAGSSDLSFDLELVLELSYPPLPTPDAGAPDAATLLVDANVPFDAPGLDAAWSGSDAGPPAPESNCGCGAARTVSPATAGLGLSILAILIARRRRALRRGP